MAASPSKSPGQFTGRHMLIVMLIFFGVIVSVNITMAVMASRSWTGLVVKNSYVASQKFNANLKAAHAQQRRGWKSSLKYANGKFQFGLHDRDGQPIIITNLTMHVGRPAFEQADSKVALRHVGKGIYQARTTLGAGTWAVSITGGTTARPYRRDSRFLVGADGRSGREE